MFLGAKIVQISRSAKCMEDFLVIFFILATDGFYRPQINTDWHRLRAKALIRGIIDCF